MQRWARFFLAGLLLLLLFAGRFAARADDGLARVRERGYLRVATDATYPPFEYIENENVVGFDREIGDEIGRELGIRVEFVSMEWSGVFASLETGQCDIIMAGVTITEPRKKGNAFSRPYFLSGQVLARRKGDATVTKPEDLLTEGRVVAVQQETTGQFAMEKRGMPKERLHRFDTLQDALLDARNGKSAAAVGDLPALADMIRKGYPEMELASSEPFVTENLGIVARKDSRDLVAAINGALARIMVDGRYARIYEKWMREPLPLASLAKLEEAKADGTPIPAALAKTAQVAPTGAGAVPTKTVTGSAFTIRLDVLQNAVPLLLRGAGLTLLLTVSTLFIGVPAGLFIALARRSPLARLRALATVYVEIVRGTPLLMQIYVIYFVLPALGVSLPPFAAGLAALSFNSAAYVAEIFRAGIESIDTGQREAGVALGMTDAQTMRYVILPQTVRRVLPPLTNEAVALLKDSSLVSVVALSELMRVGKEVATTAGAPTTIYLAVALLYLAMTLPLTTLVRHLENRWQPISDPKGAK
ncbi:MAG: ABC transporter substrate-binding protein/permease [Armatimonadetes bacterium]|nr:ABC transporter substrate-binding protein/permease [Armatimonadota bacterium]